MVQVPKDFKKMFERGVGQRVRHKEEAIREPEGVTMPKIPAGVQLYIPPRPGKPATVDPDIKGLSKKKK